MAIFAPILVLNLRSSQYLPRPKRGESVLSDGRLGFEVGCDLVFAQIEGRETKDFAAGGGPEEAGGFVQRDGGFGE